MKIFKSIYKKEDKATLLIRQVKSGKFSVSVFLPGFIVRERCKETGKVLKLRGSQAEHFYSFHNTYERAEIALEKLYSQRLNFLLEKENE